MLTASVYQRLGISQPPEPPGDPGAVWTTGQQMAHDHPALRTVPGTGELAPDEAFEEAGIGMPGMFGSVRGRFRGVRALR